MVLIMLQKVQLFFKKTKSLGEYPEKERVFGKLKYYSKRYSC